MSLDDVLRDLDRRQQRRPRISFLAAVVKKFGDDQAGQLAALMAYYGFVSLFPLLLVFVTVLGFALQGDPKLRDEILNGTLGQFPILGDQLKLHSLSGSALALAVGLVVAVLAGLGIMSATQNALNRIWGVPYKRRPNFIFIRLRGLLMMVILGAMVIIDLSWRELLPGVVVAAICWQLLQHLGGFYIDHILKRTTPLYGVFALVLGLLAWLYLGAQFTIFAAEINVVKARRLWPRSFFSDPLLDADKRALTASAETEERVEQQNVEVDFGPPR